MTSRDKLEELKLDLIEVKAYRDLQNESFTFGKEIVINESKVSEDAYYEILEENLNEAIEELEVKLRRRKNE